MMHNFICDMTNVIEKLSLANVGIVSRYRVIEPPDGQWGLTDGNDTWNGMVGLVVKKASLVILVCVQERACKSVRVPGRLVLV